jgi:hypothetical protein
MRRTFLLGIVLAGAAAFFWLRPAINGDNYDLRLAPDAKKPALLRQVEEILSSSPLIFEANQGQADHETVFLARGKGFNLYLARTEAVFVSTLPAPGGARAREMPTYEMGELAVGSVRESSKKAEVVRLRFLGARVVEPVGLEELSGKSNYLIGNRSITDVRQFARVLYKDLYPGIDLVFYGRKAELEYDFIVSSGADPKLIRLKAEDAGEIRMTADQGLVMGRIFKEKPRVYQKKAGVERLVDSRFVLKAANEISFSVGAYDHGAPLVIDPRVLMKRRFGGSRGERAFDVTIDSRGNLIIVGNTDSVDFPTTENAFQRKLGVYDDAFVTRMAPSGAIIYSTYLGGTNGDVATAVSVDASGNAYVAGVTGSSDFPTKNPMFRLSHGAWIAKLNPSGSSLIYSTYLCEFGAVHAIAVKDGCAYVAGGMPGIARLPRVVNAIQPFPAGGPEMFRMKLNAAGTDLLFSTYFGGRGGDYVSDMAMDSSGAVYLTGWTGSYDFPVTPNAFQTKIASKCSGSPKVCGVDAFVTKFDVTGRRIVYSTYLGGKGIDGVWGIALDPMKNVYITGMTGSSNFPTVHAVMMSKTGLQDVFVAKLNPSGSGLVYSTYFGGGYGIAVAADGAGNAYVTGESHICNKPILNPLPNSPACGRTFLSKLRPNGSLLYSSYHDLGWGDKLAVGPSDSVYLIGQTYDADDVVVARIASQ